MKFNLRSSLRPPPSDHLKTAVELILHEHRNNSTEIDVQLMMDKMYIDDPKLDPVS